MPWRPIYLGENSVFCIKENKCIKNIRKKGVDTYKEAKEIIKAILRDFKRGYTYDHYGRVIKMDRNLALRRLNFLYLLAKMHGMNQKDYQKMIKEIERAKREIKRFDLGTFEETIREPTALREALITAKRHAKRKVVSL